RLSSCALWTEGSTTRRPFRACQRRSNRWRPSMESTIYEPPVALVTRAADAQFQPHERDSGSRRRSGVVVPTKVYRGSERSRSRRGRRVRQARRRAYGCAERLRRDHRPHLPRGAVLSDVLEARGAAAHRASLHSRGCARRWLEGRLRLPDARRAAAPLRSLWAPDHDRPGVHRVGAVCALPLHRAAGRIADPLRPRGAEISRGPRLRRTRPARPQRAGLVQGTVQGPARMTSVVRRAVDHYHELLSDEVAGESQAALEGELRRRGLFFGDRALCTVLRPRFLAPAQYRFMQERSAILLRAFDRVYQAALVDAVLRQQFGLIDWEEALIERDPGFPD